MRIRPALLCVLLLAPLLARGQITDSIFYGDQPVLHPNPFGWGYIAGTNEYLDAGKYQRFDWFGEEYLVGARLVFGAKRISNAPDSVWIVVRDANADGTPGDILASVGTTTDVLDTTGVGNTFFFPDPPRFQGVGFIADSLFVGFEWIETEDDTFAVMADSTGEGEQMQRAWERISDGAGGWLMWPWWNSPDPDFEWNLDGDMWITAYLATAPLVSVNGRESALPREIELAQNYPNPFNPSTSISYGLPESGPATLTVIDALGRELAVLASGSQMAGHHTVEWNASGVPSGVYFARLQASGLVLVRKMLLLK